MNRFSLGLELSTQSVKAIVLDIDSGQIEEKFTLDYDSNFPDYGTHGGVLPLTTNERHTSPLLLLEVIDRIFLEAGKRVDLSNVLAIKLDAMQHCTVYTGKSFPDALQSFHGEAGSLKDQFASCFTRKTCPIWEDRTTAKEAEELTAAFKEEGEIDHLTGNRAELRFPASQIMKWKKQAPEDYDSTTGIHLLSSFATSLLAGKLAGVDTGDGWGTNLNSLNIEEPAWDKQIADWIDEGLSDRIGSMNHYDQLIGPVAPYFVQKYKINDNAVILAGTGDNPATLLGTGGKLTLSLGSSYTLNGVMDRVKPTNGEFNVFGFIPGKAMYLLCFSNGGKLHEDFLRKYILYGGAQKPQPADWAKFQDLAERTGFGEHIMLPYLVDETVPLASAGIRRQGFTEDEIEKNISALYFSQAAALRLHSREIGDPDEICIVAGGARNQVFRKLISNVFNAVTYTIHDADFAAPLGCAISGARQVLDCEYEEVCHRFIQRVAESVIEPDETESKRFEEYLQNYAAFESKL